MVELYDHQLAAIENLHTGAVLVGGVGSGKTLTALGYVFSKILKGKSKVLGDTSYVEPQNDISIYVITTARKRDSLDWTRESVHFGMTVNVDSWHNIRKYVAIKDSFFIFDEQRLVGKGVWVRSFYKIAKKNKWILLSATPADNWLDYIPLFVANGFYKNRSEFLQQHVVFSPFTKFPKVDRYFGVPRLIRNRDSILVNMHFVRNTIRHKVYFVLSFDEEKTRIAKDQRWNPFEDKPIRNASELCYILRKISNEDESRVKKLKELFIKHDGIILFYNFNYELDILRDFAKVNDIVSAEWNGHRHEEIPKTDDKWLYLCQYAAASEAWNATETNVVVFFSQNYSYKVLEQASGRIDRLNTPYTHLWYYHFVSKSPIDIAIKKALEKKQNFSESSFFG
jgi:hypothetical protein